MSDRTAEKVVQREAEEKPAAPRGQVIVFPNWCKGCGLCVEFCPKDVLEQAEDGHVIVARPEACIACRWCELHCPDFAIFVNEIEPEEAAE